MGECPNCKRLRAELALLRRRLELAYDRVAGQSEALSLAAERAGAWTEDDPRVADMSWEGCPNG